MYNGADRVKQVNAIEQHANDSVSAEQFTLADALDQGMTADEYIDNLCAFAMLGIDIARPEWWDEHDTMHLRKCIKRIVLPCA